MFEPKISAKNSPVKELIFWQIPDCLNIDKFRDTAPLMLARYPGGYFRNFCLGMWPQGPLNP